MPQPPPSKHALAFIFITFLLDTIGLGLVIPVMPALISELTGEGAGKAAEYGGWMLFLYAAMQFLFSPLIGNLSDRYGRKPILIGSLVMMCIDYLIVAMAPTIALVFVGRFLAGIAGATYAPANAYIADISPPEKLAQNFGLLGAAFGIGFVIGPAIGGLLGEMGPRVPFYVAAGVSLANALYGLVVIKESLAPENRRTFDLARANPLGSLLALRHFPVILWVCAVLVLMRIAHDANPTIWSFYTMLKFGWSPAEIGYSLIAVGVLTSLVFAFVTRLLIPRIGEWNAAYVGIFCGAIGFTGFGFAWAGWVMYAFMIPWALMGITMPALTAIMSREVGADQQGELQGALASLGGITSAIAPVLLAHLFGYFTSESAPVYFPGAAFFAAGLCLIAAFFLLLFSPLRQHSRVASAQQETLPTK